MSAPSGKSKKTGKRPDDGSTNATEPKHKKQRGNVPKVIPETHRQVYLVTWESLLRPLSLTEALALNDIFPEYAYYGQKRLLLTDTFQSNLETAFHFENMTQYKWGNFRNHVYEKIHAHCHQLIFKGSRLLLEEAKRFVLFPKLHSVVIKLENKHEGDKITLGFIGEVHISSLPFLLEKLKFQEGAANTELLVNALETNSGFGQMKKTKYAEFIKVLSYNFEKNKFLANHLTSAQFSLADREMVNFLENNTKLRKYRATYGGNTKERKFFTKLLTLYNRQLETLYVAFTDNRTGVRQMGDDFFNVRCKCAEEKTVPFEALMRLAFDFTFTDLDVTNTQKVFLLAWKRLTENQPFLSEGYLSIGWMTNPVNVEMNLSTLMNSLLSKHSLRYLKLKFNILLDEEHLPLCFEVKKAETLEIVFSYMKTMMLKQIAPFSSTNKQLFKQPSAHDSVGHSGETVRCLKLKHFPDLALPLAGNLATTFPNLEKLHLCAHNRIAYWHDPTGETGSFVDGLLRLFQSCPHLRVIKLADSIEKPDLDRVLLSLIERARANPCKKFAFYANELKINKSEMFSLVTPLQETYLPNCRIFAINFPTHPRDTNTPLPQPRFNKK